MAMESSAYALLTANPTLLAKVPKAQIHKSGYAGEKPVLPYITIQEIGTVPYNYLAGRPGMDSFRPTIKVHAETEGQCREIAEIVRDTLELDAYCVLADGPEKDFETRIFVHLSDWRFHLSR